MTATQSDKKFDGQGPASDRDKGCLFIVSAPSGAGKSTLCRAARDRFPDLVYSISFTTRTPRPGEENGVDYCFISRSEFETKIRQGEWAEWAKVHDHYYGTSAALLNQHLEEGRSVLLDIDVEGTRQILKRFPESISVFIMAPSIEVLRHRLEKRGTDDAEAINRRLANAEKEIAHKNLYRYVIVNDHLNQAIEAFCSIIARHQPALKNQSRLP